MCLAAQTAAKARLEALLTTHGVEHGSEAWKALGQSARDVDAFLSGAKVPKPKKPSAKASKKRKGWSDPGAGGALATAEDVEGAHTERECPRELRIH